MTEQSIEIKEGVASAPVELVITEPRPKGWMAFYRANGASSFSLIYPSDYSKRNWFTCPSPMHETRDDAIREVSLFAKDQGGEARIVLVTL